MAEAAGQRCRPIEQGVEGGWRDRNKEQCGHGEWNIREGEKLRKPGRRTEWGKEGRRRKSLGWTASKRGKGVCVCVENGEQGRARLRSWWGAGQRERVKTRTGQTVRGKTDTSMAGGMSEERIMRTKRWRKVKQQWATGWRRRTSKTEQGSRTGAIPACNRACERDNCCSWSKKPLSTDSPDQVACSRSQPLDVLYWTGPWFYPQALNLVTAVSQA